MPTYLSAAKKKKEATRSHRSNPGPGPWRCSAAARSPHAQFLAPESKPKALVWGHGRCVESKPPFGWFQEATGNHTRRGAISNETNPTIGPWEVCQSRGRFKIGVLRLGWCLQKATEDRPKVLHQGHFGPGSNSKSYHQ